MQVALPVGFRAAAVQNRQDVVGADAGQCPVGDADFGYSHYDQSPMAVKPDSATRSAIM